MFSTTYINKKTETAFFSINKKIRRYCSRKWRGRVNDVTFFASNITYRIWGRLLYRWMSRKEFIETVANDCNFEQTEGAVVEKTQSDLSHVAEEPKVSIHDFQDSLDQTELAVMNLVKDGKSLREVGKILDLNYGTVANIKKRSIEKMKRIFNA